MTTRPWKWLESTRTLQREAYGLDLPLGDEEDAATFVKENALAGIVEFVELLNEVSWKFWAHDAPFVNRARLLKEGVDVAHFLGNIMVQAGVTDEEWEHAYQTKQFENARRQREGYEVRNK